MFLDNDSSFFTCCYLKEKTQNLMHAYVQHINFSQSGNLYIVVKFFQCIQALCNEVQIFTIAASENGN